MVTNGTNPGISIPNVDQATPSVRKSIQQIVTKIGLLAHPVFSNLTLAGFSGVLKATAGVVAGGATTSDMSEGTHLYYTDARARAAISETVTGLDYNSTTGVLSLTTNYVIPTTSEESAWNAASAASHVAVTLAASADVLLGLTGQALSLDTQVTKRVLVGPISGADAAPTFRVLETTDIPALPYEASGAIATHAALTTGVHGLAITAGQTLTVTAGGTLGTAAYTASSAYEVPLSFSTGLNRATNTVTCTITQYTDALARAALSSTATGLTYTSATGVLSSATQVKNKVLVGPITGADAVPTFRVLDAADIPALAYDASGAAAAAVNGTATYLGLFSGAHVIGAATNTDAQVSAAVTASHAAVTLGTANGLSLTGQQLSLPTTATPTLAGLITGKVYPALNGVSALQVYKADGTTPVMVVDTTNSRASIGGITTPRTTFDLYNIGGVQRLLMCRRGKQDGTADTLAHVLGEAYCFIGGSEYDNTLPYYQTIGFGYWDTITSTTVPVEIGVRMTDLTGYGFGDFIIATRADGNGSHPGVVRVAVQSNGKVGVNVATAVEQLHVGGNIRADTAFNLNGTNGVTQASSAGTVCDVTALAGGIATARAQVTYITDGAHLLAGLLSFTTVNGRITAVT